MDTNILGFPGAGLGEASGRTDPVSDRMLKAHLLEEGPQTKARIAYLVNAYPKISHSFIRTEITALERMGIAVDRFTIRRSPEAFSDDEDKAEAAITTALLDGNARGLAAAVSRRFIRQPRGSFHALLQALRSGRAQGIVKSCAYFAEAAALADYLERNAVRHVHVHFGTNSTAVARLAATMTGISYSFTVHGPDEFDAPIALDLPGKIADAAFVVGVSSYGRGQLMRWAGLAHWAKIHVVRCAVAPHFLASPPAVAMPTSRLVCVARLSAQKGLPLLIEAAARLAPCRDFTIDIIGDGEGRADIAAHIARHGMQNHVRLLGWRTSDQIRGELEAARALVLPSFAEGLPVVLMEALAVGRPVIATAIAGIPELVDDGNGWLVTSGSVDALVEAMDAALDASPAQLEAMGQVGQDRIRKMHDPDGNARQLAALLMFFARTSDHINGVKA
jgi:glycosyltransferase involved in cell wall biosynthesis